LDHVDIWKNPQININYCKKGRPMGWKNVKEHYYIEHLIQVTEKGICIGNDSIHDLIVIGMDGNIRKRYDGSMCSPGLTFYQKAMDNDRILLKNLVLKPDTFTTDIVVYAYENGHIVEKLCEKVGYPNLTHDGCLMHGCTHSTDKSTIIKWAKRNYDMQLCDLMRSLKIAQRKVDTLRYDIETIQSQINSINLNYPNDSIDEL